MYNNPYLYNNFFPYQNMQTGNFQRRGLFSSLFGSVGKINWNNFLNNTQKTLNVINQASNVYYQVKPIYTNAKTMLRMAHALKDDDNISKNTIVEAKKETSTGPVFFL